MDPEEIARLCASLSLTERDGPVRKLEESLRVEAVNRMSLCLVGKILSNKIVNREAFMRVIGKIWYVKEGFEIESVTGNVFTFFFRREEDRQRVIDEGPWSFNNALLVLQKPDGQGTIESIQFHKAEFLVQIHQVPILCMTRKIGWFLGSMIGEVVEVDGGNVGEAGGNLCVLEYERLPSHCFKCGMVDHCTYECPSKDIGVENLQFGLWMRASTPFSKYKNKEKVGAPNERNHASLTVAGGGGRLKQFHRDKLAVSKDDDQKVSLVMDSRLKHLSADGKDDDSQQILEPMVEENIEGSIEETSIEGASAEFVGKVDLAFNDKDASLITIVDLGMEIGLDPISVKNHVVLLGMDGENNMGGVCQLSMDSFGPKEDIGLSHYEKSDYLGQSEVGGDQNQSVIKKGARWVRKVRDFNLGKIGETQFIEIGRKRDCVFEGSEDFRRKKTKRVSLQVEGRSNLEDSDKKEGEV
ncbi:hypothetical protein EZV62_021853 [Acer yangbiense]|uniref:DUF4283 domain-containing protein n=1 Tax=Acer yangbiense TaxID=1000413 RepID=A0A5C7H6S6_9ROSI|nr:hypothetical protein EZV62_021853 [Acer yangbiense]